MLIEEKINKIKEDFSFFENWEDKYQYLIDLGKKLPLLENQYKKDEFRVQGCTSNLWVVPKYHNNKLTFLGASDSVIVQGLFYLVKYVLDNEYPKTIISEPLDFFDEIGLSSHLGPSRSNGLNSLKRQIKNLATELQKN
ncbi:MAG: SufE family protein [alpha proteobacterium HIMB59]|nr:MAG: SufE family protein [alpha proteobacterium HIMB59]|tara:strand:+ start:2397 stop:2813 length:417 start_codon:yes stop_codon:yes gene_type:complete